jgi:hypothetical protein
VRHSPPDPLLLSPAPGFLVNESARCPQCDNPGGVVGRLGRRLVFRCSGCRVRFHRSRGPLAIDLMRETFAAENEEGLGNLAAVGRRSSRESIALTRLEPSGG